MSFLQICDAPTCGETIAPGTERVDVSMPNRLEAGTRVDGDRFNYHLLCYQAQGIVLPGAGISVLVTHIPDASQLTAPTPATLDAIALADPLRAPTL